MATAERKPDECLHREVRRRQDLQEMLREVGLSVEYWLPKLQEHLGVTCVQALQYLEAKDLQNLNSEVQYPWEKRALEKLLILAQSNSLSESQKAEEEIAKKNQDQAEKAMQELRGLLSAGKQRQEEAVRNREAEQRQTMDIPIEQSSPPQMILKEVLENKQRELNPKEGTLAHRQKLSDRELVRWTSGGLALRGIYKTSSESDLLEKREELLSVPKDFSLSGPEQGTRMETKEFTSSEDESTFTQGLKTLNFSSIAATKGGGLGCNLEAGGNNQIHSDSKKTQQSHSQCSYFCSIKLNYVPLASCHFAVDQLQFSNTALQELQCIEGLLGQSAHTDRSLLLRQRTKAFFHRFGSHANQGPLQLGGIYCLKAVAEGFQSDKLEEVREKSSEALECYVRGSYSEFRVKAAAGIEGSASHSKASSEKTNSQQLQAKFQLSTSHTGGPPEANSLSQWKDGLVASNQTWCVIDKKFQLVPVWDIILSSHSTDFKDPFQLASYLKDSYTSLTGLIAQIQDGKELLGAGTRTRAFIEDVKPWKVADPERQLKHLGELQKQSQRLFLEKKQFQESHDNENNKWELTENSPFRELLQRLGLQHYYPKKLSRDNFHLICKASMYNFQPSSEQELPFCFLQKLLMLDYRLRYLIFKADGNTEMQDHPTDTSHENDAFDPYEDLFEDLDSTSHPSSPDPSPHIHPMDIQMAILYCVDDFARQSIMDKLAICQFALPLLIPNPCSSQIEFPLWSLSQIRRSWQQSGKSAYEKYTYRNQQMYRVSTPIVSFVRVGNGFSASKSQIMNCLVSQHKHDVFFHRHCRGSRKDCLLMEGVVEICWFCPGGEEGDRFDNCLTFTNLHGDVKEHEKQLTFLQEVSSLFVVLMSASDDNKENREIVRDLCHSSKPLIFLLDDKEKITGCTFSHRMKIGVRNRNEAELTEELATTIRGLLEQSDAALSLQACAQIAHKQGFLIDEDQRDCKESKKKAERLIALLGDMQISQMKENLLPLQGELWHLWCKKDKELYHLRQKGIRKILQHKNEIETEKKRIRHQQLTRAFLLNDLIRSVLEILQEFSESRMNLYFLQWLSVVLDNMTAGYLETLNIRKKNLYSQIQTEKQTVPKSKYLKTWESEVEALSKEINDCTLGIEHLLREIGLIYEALEEYCSTKNSLFQFLPQIAADLLIAGVSIELMDGDASYVPLKWVAAVFDKVADRLGDKKLFVLSILGLQSSGKSTLLTALFGLEFTVSAGRCTRGAYMQLLKVEETFAQELGFDFILVVDTQGLQAPEFNNKSQNLDELATFVTGLGNLTLVNLWGGNLSEMQDILQIVVQTFVRMKQVKISPSCLFVHQNVGEVKYGDQTMEARRRLEQRLDEMAATVAEQEQCSDINRFCDVIKFDVNTHVFYFAHLWDGNPPMAPLNPSYIDNAQELKSRILMIAKQDSKVGSIMKILDVKQRVQDLWRALVSGNFIFNSRNTKEVMAMSKLETMYNSWSLWLRSHVLDLQDKLINQILNGEIQTLQASTVEAPVTKLYEAIKQKIEIYFNENSDDDILTQDKESFEEDLIALKKQLIFETQRKATDLISFKQSQKKFDDEKSSYEKELLKRSQDLALTVNIKQLSETELYKNFSQHWEKWVCDMSSKLHPVSEFEIDVDAEYILLQHFQKEKNLLKILNENHGKMFQINYDKHIQMNKTYYMFTKQLEAVDQQSINTTTDHIVSKCKEAISTIKQQQHDYNSCYFQQILTIIEQEVNSAPTKDRYIFTRRYKVDLSSSLFQYASNTFKEMHREFKQANDLVKYLESKKDDFFMSFKLSCQVAIFIKNF